MKVIKLINGDEVTLIFNGRSTKQIRAKYPQVDPFQEKNDWMDDPDIIEYMGYEAARQGARFNEEKFKYSLDKFGALVDPPIAIEIVKAFVESYSRYAQYIIDNTEKKQEAGKQ